MTQSLITSAVSESKIGHIKDLLTPVLRRLLKDDEHAQALVEAGNKLQDGFTALVRELLGKLTNTYMVTVDYNCSIPEMIQAGKYGYVDNDIADYFPTTQVGKQDLEIVPVHFGKDMESDDVLSELDKLGLRPVTLSELLAFGETHPKAQLEFPIIALGSIRRSRFGCRIPYLWRWGNERRLLLGRGLGWGGGCRFAAVRK